MIILLHSEASKALSISSDRQQLEMPKGSLVEVFWKLAEKYPDEIIAWCEKSYAENLNIKSWRSIFNHDMIMASQAVKTVFLDKNIGYIDQLPFVNVNRTVQFGTWQMSADVGGITGKTLLKFKPLFQEITDFSFLLNSIAKIGQQNGLFCYHVPNLVTVSSEKKLKTTASTTQLFQFVYAHYKSIRFFLLLWCFIKYENRFPLFPLFKAILSRKYFKKEVDLSEIRIKTKSEENFPEDIDIIIPTMGRRKYLLQVLEDLKKQSLLPKKVIVVEQNQQPESSSELPELNEKTWPFEIVHYFTHKTGACKARNKALEEVSANWVFFADDDNKMENDILEKAIREINKYKVDLLTFNYRQKGEKLVFDKVKQWGTFGTGNSLVSGEFAKKIRFDLAFEHGYAEDKDYGMQLRYAGCDIIYHPEIEITHLKAPAGGFREIPEPAWEKEQPKPSPTLMLYAKKYYTLQQINGFKAELFLRYYFRQDIKNPWRYIKNMRSRWKKSEQWAKELSKPDNV